MQNQNAFEFNTVIDDRWKQLLHNRPTSFGTVSINLVKAIRNLVQFKVDSSDHNNAITLVVQNMVHNHHDRVQNLQKQWQTHNSTHTINTSTAETLHGNYYVLPSTKKCCNLQLQWSATKRSKKLQYKSNLRCIHSTGMLHYWQRWADTVTPRPHIYDWSTFMSHAVR